MNKEKEKKNSKKKKGNLNKKEKMTRFIFVSTITLTIIGASVLGHVEAQKKIKEESEFKEKSYVEFIEDVKEKKIDYVEYSEKEDYFKVYTKDEKYKTSNPAYEDFKKDLLLNSIQIKKLKTLDQKEIVSNVSNFGGLMVSIFILFLLVRMLKGGEEYSVDIKKEDGEGIDSLAGFDELKEEISLVVDTFKNREKYEERGVRPSKGIMLYGPTGVGKTKIARLIAAESGINFISAKGSGFDQKFVGTGAARVRKLFAVARKNSPCVLFIDEIDAIGTKRKEDDSAVYVQSLNALLEEMDGFNTSEGVLVIAATNRLEALDPALLRPGRFDRKIKIPHPNENDRLEIIKYYMKNIKIETDFDLDYMVDITSGLSPAEIESLVNEMMVESLRTNEEKVSSDSLEKAMIKLQSGGYLHKASKKKDPVIAYHEAGHAVVAQLFNRDVRRVSINGLSSGAGGYTLIVPDENLLKSKRIIEEDIIIMYAGRASEQLYFEDKKDITVGASSDISQATRLIKSMVESFGFLDNDIINLTGDSLSKKEKEDEMRKIAARLYGQTVLIVRDNKEKIKRMSNILLEKETIGKNEVIEIVKEC